MICPDASDAAAGDNIGFSSEDILHFHAAYAQDCHQIWSQASRGIAAYDSKTIWWRDACKFPQQS
jgi:hypothetical protein